MMKRFLLAGTFFFLCSHVHSQKHQISAGMGFASSNQILDVFETGLTYIFGPTSLSETKELGEFRFAYAYTPQERWHYGAMVSFSQNMYDVKFQHEKIGEQKTNYYTVAAEAGYTYLKNDKFNMYALLGAGATFRSLKQTRYSSEDNDVKDQDTLFNFQVTPVGARYGKQWGAFAELGFGYRGIFSFGAFYNFD